jgi:lysophospholipase L1-like esterase
MRYADTSDLLDAEEVADGLHPNAAGYRQIAAMWERHILDVTGLRAAS